MLATGKSVEVKKDGDNKKRSTLLRKYCWVGKEKAFGDEQSGLKD